MKNLFNFICSAFIAFTAFVIFAATPVSAQTCTTPNQTTGVSIEFPSCVGEQCNLSQANCLWNAVTGATKYQVTVTQVESSTVVQNQQVTATNLVFNVEQNKTYKCDVSAINACGTSGLAGTYSLFCKVDALVSSPTPAPTTPPATPVPTLVPTGDISPTVIVGLAGLILFAVGAFLVVL